MDYRLAQIMAILSSTFGSLLAAFFINWMLSALGTILLPFIIFSGSFLRKVRDKTMIEDAKMLMEAETVKINDEPTT